MSSSRPNDRFRDIIRNIDAIEVYTRGMDQEQFLADSKTCDATERCLSRIGEAASKRGLLAEELAPGHPWNDIHGLGNWLRRGYPDVLRETIWKTVASDLVSLRRDCEAALQVLEQRIVNRCLPE